MVGCMIESSLGITAAAHFTPLVDIVDLDGAALLADDPFVGATIDGGQVTPARRPGARRQAAMTDALRPGRSPAPARHPLHLPHSRGPGRPGRPGRAGGGAGPPPRADRHRGRGRRATRPTAAARDISPRPIPSPRCSGALLAHRASGWRATTARRSASTLKAMLPGRDVGRVAGDRRRCGTASPAPAGSPARCSPGWSSGAGKPRCATAARALKRPLWDVVGSAQRGSVRWTLEVRAARHRARRG